MTTSRPCKRCEPEPDFLDSQKIASIAAEIKIDSSLASEEEVYKMRLAECNECEALREKFLCFYCGCFISFRARTAKSYCPHPEGDKWKKNELHELICRSKR